MALQVRLVHALGDRLIDLAEKTIDSPVVVGRAGDADLPVPVVSVSRRQCLLYVQDGQWVVADGKAGSGSTFLNGKPITRPTLLRSGDVLTLGHDPSPPKVMIDPFGLMPEPQLQAATAKTPARAAYAGAATSPPPPPPRAPSGRAALVAAPPAPPPEPVEDETSQDDWLNGVAAAAAASSASQRFYVPRQNAWTPAVIWMLVLSSLAIVGAAGFASYVRLKYAHERQRAADAAAKQQVQQVKTANAAAQAEADRLHKLAVEADARRDQERARITAAANAAAQDPGRQTEQWKRVEEMRSNPDPRAAIVIYSDYLKQNPTTPYAADLRKYTEDALDALWWQHVDDLVDERTALKKDISEKNTFLAQATDADFKKSLEEEKAQVEEKLQRVEDQLKELNYQADAKPNLFNTELMADLRRARNAQKYEDWKQSAEKMIKESRGQRPVW
jgi:hypothetical protein